MPKIVPIKNVDPVLVDVKDPAVDYGSFNRFTSLNLSHVPLPPAVSASRRPFFTVAVLLLMIFSAYFLSVLFNLNNAKEVFAKKGHLVINNFSSALAAIKNFSPREATSSLNENKRALEDLNKMLKRNSGDALFQAAGTVIPVFKEASGLLGQVTDFNLNFLAISEKLSDLQANGFKYFQSDGASLTKNLSKIHDLVGKTLSGVESVRNTTANLKDASPLFANFNETISDEYIKYSGELQIWDKALISLLKIIGSPEDAHIALLFQNPAEIRPGGGFIGSYADLVINNGQMKNIDVQDIYWPDHPLNFELKVVPPRPLRTLTKDWGARDGNWFFDFPTSAKTVLGFLEASKLYAEPGVKFEGAMGVNIKVLETVLGLTGPISITEYDMTIDKNNFLIELQREVEAGEDKKKGENPKKILKVLTPLIFEKLNNLSPEETVELFEKIKKHIEKKDIMIFAREANLANVLASTDVNGAVYSLPNDFWGSYLAVVNANIAGGKSDAFVNQAIEGRIDVDTDGGIFTDLSIVREHNGNKEKDPWWRAENKNFIQIFGNPGSSLVSLKGNAVKNKLPLIDDYKILNYETNPDLAVIEETEIFLNNYSAWMMEAFGKIVFATWFNTPAGKTGTLNVRYQTPGGNQTAVAPGKVFQFIYERQSGVKSAVRLKIGAPLGYVWTESKSPLFVYEDEDPNGRIILNLTLER